MTCTVKMLRGAISLRNSGAFARLRLLDSWYAALDSAPEVRDKMRPTEGQHRIIQEIYSNFICTVRD